jgi:hypothetical protein
MVAPPANPWLGTWTLISVNGAAVPTDIVVDGYPSRVTSRKLTLLSDGVGVWEDSSAALCPRATPSSGQLCTVSGSALVQWMTGGDTLSVRATAISGYVAPYKTFVRQADGSLLKTDDALREVYHRQ